MILKHCQYLKNDVTSIEYSILLDLLLILNETIHHYNQKIK